MGVSDKVLPPVDLGHPDAVSLGGREFVVGGGERGPLLSGDVKEGVEEKVPEVLPQAGCMDKGGRPDGLDGAQDAEAQHFLVAAHSREALLYRGGVVEDEGGRRLGRCVSWWCVLW